MADTVIATGKIIATKLKVRGSASINGKVYGTYAANTTINIYETINTSSADPNNPLWVKTKYDGYNNGGYVYASVKNRYDGTYIEITQKSTSTSQTATTTSTANVSSNVMSTNATSKSSGFDNELIAMLKAQTSNGKSYVNASTRLFGMPFQFMDTVDPRIDGISKVLGRSFVENIVAEAPILTIIPGVPKYLTSKESKDYVNNVMANSSDAFDSFKTPISATTGLRYYDFKQDYQNYMHYVNMLCRVSSGFLSLNGKKIDGTTLAKYDWKNYRYRSGAYVSVTEDVLSTIGQLISQNVGSAVSGAINYISGISSAGTTKGKTVVSNSEEANKIETGNTDVTASDLISALDTNCDYVQFYIDPSTFSESSRNSTTESKLQQIATSGNELFKEAQFIMDSGGASDVQQTIESFGDNALTSLQSLFSSGNSSFSSVVSRIADFSKQIIDGSVMIFPKIYTGSDYSRNYNIKIHLQTPYGDRYSYYQNILVPLMHIVGLTAPRQTSANSYSSPFIIKAYLPGIFNCELGIVDSVNISKNPEGDALSVDGYPLSVDVDLSIIDLYSDLMIAPTTDVSLFLSNTSLIDYLATNCGLDMTTSKFSEKVEMIMNNLSNWITDIPSNAHGVITTYTDNLIRSWLNF